MEWGLSIFYCLLLAFVLYKCKVFHANEFCGYLFPAIFIIKCIVGISYSQHLLNGGKGGDMFWYMYETNYLFESCKQQPFLFLKYILGFEDETTRQFTGIISTWNKSDFLFNDARTVLRINLVVRLISAGLWQVHTVVFCFFSMAGLIHFIKFLITIFQANKVIITCFICFIPSVLLWSSLILKESIFVCVSGIFLYSINRVITLKTSLKTWLVAIAFFLMLFAIKSFIILILLPFLTAYYLSLDIKSTRWILFRWATVLTFFFLIGIVSSYVSQEVSLPHRLYIQQQSSLKFAVYMGDKSYYRPPIIAPCWLSVIKRSTEAVYNVMSLPHYSANEKSDKKAAAIENVFLAAALLFSVYFLWRKRRFDLNFCLLCLCFVFTLYAITGLTTAVLGAMVRYKLPGLLFIGGFCAYAFSLINKPEFKS